MLILEFLLCSWKQTSFTPPPERAEFIDSKEKFDLSKVSEMEELKKLLMRRAIKTIPILLSLQNEGSSIERLYKRGMLTDDMHFKVKELKAFVDKEFQDIQFEADELVEGWGQHIWPQAMQFHQVVSALVVLHSHPRSPVLFTSYFLFVSHIR